MNKDFIFWRDWSVKEKSPLFLSFLGLLLLLFYGVYAWLEGLENIITWDVITELKEKTIQTPSLYFDQFSFSSTSPLWYVTETYAPSLLKINVTAYTILLGSVLFGLTLILGGLSRLRGVWFLAGALLLGLVLSSFRLESVFLVSKNWPFLVAFSVAGLTYYLSNLYASKLNIFTTTLIWLIVWSILVAILLWKSIINEPLLSLSAYGLIGALIITAVFVFLISHEIVSGLFLLVSENSEKGKSSMPQLLVVTAVFSINALLIYLENAKRIDSSAFIFPPIVIYIISLILGFWGFSNISHQRSWFSYRGVGAWIYLGMAIISSATIGMAYATANEPLVELIEDYISITFLVSGLCFFVYVFINFQQIIKAGMPFHKVLYKPPFTRFLLVRIAAVFIIFFVFSLKNRFSYFQLQSGLSNAIADFYLEEGDLKTAEVFYKSGANYDLSNQRSNLSLASLASLAGDKVNSVYFYRQAGSRTPSPQAILGESKNLQDQDMFFEALFSLKKGLEFFPNDHRLYTQLAHLQAKAHILDSVLIHLNKAKDLCENCEAENANFLAFWIENGKQEKLEEMRGLVKDLDGYALKANQAAIDRLIGKEIVFDHFNVAKDSSLDMGRAAYLLNAMSNPATLNKTKITEKSLQAFQEKQINDGLYEQLSWAYANQNYYRENKLQGLKQMTILAESRSPLAPLYHQTLGLWLMREGAYQSSISHLEKARDSVSIRLLSSSDLKIKLEDQLKAQAETLTQNISLENYADIINKAPVNPWLLVKVADFLTKKGKDVEAYHTLLYGQEVVHNSPILLQSFIQKALKLSMFEYAEEGLEQLKPLASPAEISSLQKTITQARIKAQRNFN
jgi:tetratricopeptide (TPR) repeat protein